MSIDVADWLRGLGLGQYAPAFAANDIDGEVLLELTVDDLTGLGITSIGHRRKLLAAIAALRGGAPEPVIETPPRPAAAVGGEAERRQLTVMFCDLVGSTPLSTRFDPEDLREVIAAYHTAVAGETARFGGYVARYMGDGALIYFGYPQAHEDDAERAVRAGLALAERVSRLDTLARLEARIAVASGLVVVGDLIGEGETRQRDVVGETPNLAARLQELAPPGGVVIAEATRRLLGELFECRDLGAVEIRGFAETVPIFQVLRPSAVESRFEALHATKLTALVGRNEELDLLLRHWRRAKAGEGQVVLVSGEAGIGKSRLTVELHERLAGEPHTRLRYFCSPHHQDSALYPVIAQLERAAGFGHEDVAEEKLGKLRALLAAGARDNDEIELLAELLSLPNSSAELNLSPQRRREMLFAALLLQLEVLARNQPVLTVYEDLHWIDPSLRELLDLIVERVSRLSVLLVVTFRPEFEAPWSQLPHVSALTLNRLDSRAGAAMVDNIVGDRTLPSEVAAEIVERTDGIPLFVEELTKAVLEASASGEQIHRTLSGAVSSASAVPPALHASLIARLDRLGPVAREVAQAGAAIGREFAYELLAPIVHLDEPSLVGALDRLTGSGLVFQRGTPPRATFLFKHSLVRDAAYATLLRRRRQELHAAIASALERNFPSIVTAQPEVLAHHCSEAGLTELAIEYWRRAGERAVRQSANEEAISHLTAGLVQLRQLPDTPSRAKQELALQLAMGQASYAARGFASREATQAFNRARELCAASADDGGIHPTLFGVWLFEYGAAYYADAGRTAVETLARAARTTAPAPISWAT
jgi:class 3 adenylate cyclase